MKIYVHVHLDPPLRLGPLHGPIVRLSSKKQVGRGSVSEAQVPGVPNPWVDLLYTGSTWYLIAEPDSETVLTRATGEQIEATERLALQPLDTFEAAGGPPVSIERIPEMNVLDPSNASTEPGRVPFQWPLDEPTETNSMGSSSRGPNSDSMDSNSSSVDPDDVDSDSADPDSMDSEFEHVAPVYGLPPDSQEMIVRELGLSMQIGIGPRRPITEPLLQIGVGGSCQLRVQWSGRVRDRFGILVRLRENQGRLWMEDLSGLLRRDEKVVEWEPIEPGYEYQLGHLVIRFSKT